ncbi:KPN_02809 family neutral zinc metallopeptidase [Sphingobium sp.]|uniref:KPN_02809 family neutral zinc metallopeptidase n=1 Tax=Sphingobium sp. TaxID=1912891 RepID=UPI002C10EA6A|nr:neutral zinc metallopeptidase [Sphingobium sp.]HUD93779.1 neutral zinc metallopeptidase [Sphingobium sp.]
MRLDDEQESSHYEVQDGRGGGFGGGGLGGGLGMLLPLIGSRFGCGGIVVVLIIMMVLGMNPLSLVGGGGQQQAPVQSERPSTNELTDVQRVSLKVLGSTERRWADIFKAEGQQYPPPTLVFYSQNGQSGCGAAQSAMGPFYCPADQRIYLDTDFFREMETRFDAPGDFPIGYIIAHEVGHHIQTITGEADRIRKAQRSASEADGNALQVKMELQADCYAGVWAARDTNLMEPGDLEEGMRAAEAIGDDTLQKAAGRRPVPESFTHGTSAERMTWLRKGLATGDPAQCDTFKGAI